MTGASAALPNARGPIAVQWAYAALPSHAAAAAAAAAVSARLNVTVSLPGNVRTTVVMPYPYGPGTGSSVTGSSACPQAGSPEPTAAGLQYALAGVAGTCTFLVTQAAP
jgi:hypothetical protein